MANAVSQMDASARAVAGDCYFVSLCGDNDHNQ